MDLESRIQAFALLGDYLKNDFYLERSDELLDVELNNPWFSQDNIKLSLDNWSDQLNIEVLRAWLVPYRLTEVNVAKRVLVIMAGNIPLVGFHDFLSVIIFGHKLVIKLSSNDNILLPLLINKLIDINPGMSQYIEFIDDIEEKIFDAVIATGSDNSAKYFEYYFRQAKKVIRKNRRSVALIDGTESDVSLRGLAYDVFGYFGLGCRSVSKVFLPEGYDLDRLFEVFYPFKDILDHKKYSNNYDYNKAVLLIGKNNILENGFLIMKEDKSFLSPVAVLYYEYYKDISIVKQFLKDNSSQLQCIVSQEHIQFGSAQKPKLWDYADGIDIISFLKEL